MMQLFKAGMLIFVTCTVASAQAGTLTPNIGLQVPGFNQSNWQVPINYDLNRLDLLLSGGIPLPGLSFFQLQYIPQYFSSLPLCTVTLNGATAAVIDSTTETWGAVIAGSGSYYVFAYCNGTQWIVQPSAAGGLITALVNPMTTLGDMMYGGASGIVTRLAGNTSSTPKYLKSLGTGSAANAPTLTQIQFSDLTGFPVVTDQGGQVYNVKAYGALGNGATNDLAAIDTTIGLCNTNGGTLYFPVGNFVVNATPTAINLRICNVQGTGKASVIQATSGTTGLALLKIAGPSGIDTAEHNQFIKDIALNCNSSNPSFGTGRQNNGLWLLDAPMIKTSNLSVANCTNSVLMESSTYFEERDTFDVVTLENFVNGFLMQEDNGDTNNSFDHNSFNSIYFNTYVTGDAVFHLTGGASAIGDSFTNLNGNLGASGATYTSLFLLDGGSQLQDPYITGLAEANSGSTYVFYGGTAAGSAGPCLSVNNCVTGQGTLQLNLSGGTVTQYGGSHWGQQLFIDLGNFTNFLPTPSFSGSGVVLDNPNFVMGTAGWSWGGTTVIAQDISSPFTNGSSMKVTTATQFNGAQTKRNYAAYPGEVMTFSAYLKSDGTFETGVYLAAVDGAGNLLSYPIELGNCTSGCTSWTLYSGSAVMPSETQSVYVVVSRQDASGGTQSGWATNLTLQNSSTIGTRFIPALFASLPACGSTVEGLEEYITDGTVNTWGATVAGSGSNHVKVLCDGTNWTVEGK